MRWTIPKIYTNLEFSNQDDIAGVHRCLVSLTRWLRYDGLGRVYFMQRYPICSVFIPSRNDTIATSLGVQRFLFDFRRTWIQHRLRTAIILDLCAIYFWPLCCILGNVKWLLSLEECIDTSAIAPLQSFLLSMYLISRPRYHIYYKPRALYFAHLSDDGFASALLSWHVV